MAMVVEGPPLSGYNRYQTENFTMDSNSDEPDRKYGLKGDGEDSRSDSRMTGSDSRPKSALARGVQITEFAESRVNPTPLFLEESDILLEQYLSPGKLQLLTGVDNLETVESLELKVDSRETSLGNFGSLLPNLQELKLSGSNISTVRDLGSSLRRLRVLWLTRCGLEELDGISSMLNLKELYLEYNEITDLSPLSMLEHLEIVDLEGNNIDDITQVQYLSLCPRLRRLALDGNPICVMPTPTYAEPGYDYRETIKSLLPHLLVLDDERLDDPESSSIKHNVFDDDWAYLEELQKDAFLQSELAEEQTDTPAADDGDRPPTAALRPATGYRPGSALRPSSGFRPMSASKRPSTMSPGTQSRPGTSSANRPVSSDAVEGIESSSELTMGGVICGNPSKALRQRKQGGPGSKDEIRKGLNKLMQKGAVFSHSDDAEDVPFKPEDEMNSIIEELQSWKVEHEKRMEVIMKSKEAQVLVVDHDEAEDVECPSDDDEDELELMRSDSATGRNNYRPPSSRQRHTADLRLKTKTPTISAVDRAYSQLLPGDSLPLKSQKKLLSGARGASASPDAHSFDQSFDDEDNNYDSAQYSERPLSSSSLSGYQRPLSRGGGLGDLNSEFDDGSHQRPRSRGQGDSGLAPLRAPSPNTARIINSMRSKQTVSPPSPKPRKLRVGPTGLPLSSQSQQPVIRNSIVPPQSRPGLIPNSRPGSGRTNVALLPSQPRIARQLPEPPTLFPHPPPTNS